MTREEWLRHAVEELDSQLFEGGLNLLEHQYQISCGKCGGKRAIEIYQPYQGEDVKMEDFFPTTITVSHTIADPVEMLGQLARGCIMAFFNITKVNKEFKTLANKYYFEAPYSEYVPSDYLKEILMEIYNRLKKQYGEWPGVPVVVHPKDKTKQYKSTVTVFCPNCDFEMTVKKTVLKKHNNLLPTCGCGTKMGLALDEESNQEE